MESGEEEHTVMRLPIQGNDTHEAEDEEFSAPECSRPLYVLDPTYDPIPFPPAPKAATNYDGAWDA